MKEALQKLVLGVNLTYQEAQQALREILTGQSTNAQTAAFLTALKMKGETTEELIAFASTMRENCVRIYPQLQGRLVDTCGTGGDAIKTFNVSTVSAFIIAGAGVYVAKHGNRGVTSKSGSADVLEKLGVNLGVEPKTVQDIIEKVSIGFMFAPVFHPAMKNAALPRQEIGFRTVFNLLGPLTNPAGANAQLLGVYDSKLTEPMAYTLDKLGCEEAMIVNGADGLDEISTVGKSTITRLINHNVLTMETSPSDFGLQKAEISDLQTSTPDESAKDLFEILSGNSKGAKVDMALVNSAAGIIVGGKAEDFSEGIAAARESIQSGAAFNKLKLLVKASGGSLQKLEELEALQ